MWKKSSYGVKCRRQLFGGDADRYTLWREVIIYSPNSLFHYVASCNFYRKRHQSTATPLLLFPLKQDIVKQSWFGIGVYFCTLSSNETYKHISFIWPSSKMQLIHLSRSKPGTGRTASGTAGELADTGDKGSVPWRCLVAKPMASSQKAC